MTRDTRHAVYVISVAAELAGMHPQTLRIYERKGLLEPARTSGGSRRYSQADIDHLRRIQELTDEGLNLAGVKKVLELETRLARAERELESIRQQASLLAAQVERSSRADLVPLRQAVAPFGDSTEALRRLFGQF
ncbi:MAG: hypothetical protein RLZZ31_502 [Actinomycetota bacterium]|jgi:MerR family transcriptional regulator/heat shock protein HspR